ncbi:MAG TPA: hypothetical protein VIO14_14490 [Dehalococcoidia bacterium]
MEPVEVAAYAGYRAAERPRAVRWRGQWRQVTAVEEQWREPDGRAFIVRLEGGERLRLLYREGRDVWSATTLG